MITICSWSTDGQLTIDFQLVTHLYHVEFSLALIIFPRNHHDGPRVLRSNCGCPIGLLLWWQILFFDRYSVLIHLFELFSQSPPSGLSTSFENRKWFSLFCFQGPHRWKQPKEAKQPKQPPEELNLFLSNILVRKHISHFSGNKETSRKESPWGGGMNNSF